MAKSHVALTKCFFCGKDDCILLATGYNSRGEPLHDLSEAHGKVANMIPCSECEGHMKQGVILLTIDDAKSEKDWDKPPKTYPGEKDRGWMPNPYRTGGFFVVTDEAIRRIINPQAMADWAIKHRWMFIEHEAAEKIGLFALAKS